MASDTCFASVFLALTLSPSSAPSVWVLHHPSLQSSPPPAAASSPRLGLLQGLLGEALGAPVQALWSSLLQAPLLPPPPRHSCTHQDMPEEPPGGEGMRENDANYFSVVMSAIFVCLNCHLLWQTIKKGTIHSPSASSVPPG